jgi:hypothetical protein
LNFFVFLRFELLLSPNKNDFQNFIELPLIEKGGFVSAGWLTKIVSG